MKKRLFALLTITCMLSLCACGNSGKVARSSSAGSKGGGVSVVKSSTDGDNDSKTGLSDSDKDAENGSSDSTSSKSKTAVSVKEKVEKLLVNPDDEKYFKPISDDYMYVCHFDEESPDSDTYLYAFDNEGNLIQCIERLGYEAEHEDEVWTDWHVNEYGRYGNTVRSADTAVLYVDMLNFRKSETVKKTKSEHALRTDKWYYLSSIYENSSDFNDTVYVSKKLKERDSRFYEPNCEDIFFIDKMKSLASQYGSDYLLKTSAEPPYHHEASIYRKNGVEIELIGAYDSDCIQIYVFNDQGEVVKQMVVMVLGDENQAMEYCYGAAGNVLADVEKNERVIDQNSLNEYFKTHTVKENMVISYHDDFSYDEDKYKWSSLYIMRPEYDCYFSVPYLTDRQIDNYLKYYGVE